MRNAELKEAQAEIKIAGRNINNLRYADDTTLMAGSEKELKSLLMKVLAGINRDLLISMTNELCTRVADFSSELIPHC